MQQQEQQRNRVLLLLSSNKVKLQTTNRGLYNTQFRDILSGETHSTPAGKRGGKGPDREPRDYAIKTNKRKHADHVAVCTVQEINTPSSVSPSVYTALWPPANAAVAAAFV